MDIYKCMHLKDMKTLHHLSKRCLDRPCLGASPGGPVTIQVCKLYGSIQSFTPPPRHSISAPNATQPTTPQLQDFAGCPFIVPLEKSQEGIHTLNRIAASTCYQLSSSSAGR